MTATHHPSADWMLAYASGNMANGHALAISAHLSTCTLCRQKLATLNDVGGSLLAQLPPSALASDSWEKLNRRLQQSEKTTELGSPSLVAQTHSNLPSPLHKLLPNGLPRKWTRLSPSLRQATLKELPDGTLIALHHIRAGGKVPQHTHEGCEVTLVLNGSFSDHNGLYQTSDFIVADELINHSPTAVQNEDCLCLTIQSAPLRLTGPIGRWFNPLVRALR